MIYTCPVCKKILTRDCMRLFCENGHSYDISRKGYVNLLLSSSASHGDNKEMINARRNFLNSGYYDKIIDRLCNVLYRYVTNGILLDCGCGEGYYTAKTAEMFPNIDIYGFDISAYAVSLAAGKYKTPDFFVASVNDIPIKDECVDIAVNIFSPLSVSELYRVLKPGAIFVYAVPTENHLFGLKSIIYDTPYKNKCIFTEYDGFSFVERVRVVYDINLDTQNALNLYKMTPYYYNSPKNSSEKITSYALITTEVGFDFLVYKKGA